MELVVPLFQVMARPPLLEESMKLKTREGDAPVLEADSCVKKV
jgi:hypothetical protein